MRKAWTRVAGLAGLLLAALPAAGQLGGPPATLDTHDSADPGTLERMRACSPRGTEQLLARWRQALAKGGTVETTVTAEAGDRAALVERSGLWVCLPLSAGRMPLLPVDTVLQTVRPVGGLADKADAYGRAIATSLAESGFARGLIMFDNGNAMSVLYAVSAEKPYEIAYENKFLKRDEYRPAEYAIRLEDAGVKTVSVAGAGGTGNRRDIMIGRQPSRQVVDGYLVRPGNDRTTRFDFTGTVWKSTVSPSTSYALQRDGIMVYRSRTSTGFGNWRLRDGVLYFELNKYTYYSAVMDDQDYLQVEARNTVAPTPSLPGVPNYETAPRENRFRMRLYQEGNAKAERAAMEQLDAAGKALQLLVDFEKQRILAESPEEEARQQAGKGPASGGRHQLTLCAPPLLGLAVSVAEARNARVGELCLSYFGTRKEWKDTILREGCNGRCSAF